MTIKRVFRYESGQRKLRLFHVVWDRGRVGYGGCSYKFSVAFRPVLAGVRRAHDGWRIALLGLEVHLARSWGGRFV